MDAQAKKKALFRAKLNAQKQQKQRIDSPIIRIHVAILVAKHSRTLLCHVCHSPTLWKATGLKLVPMVSVCHGCADGDVVENRGGAASSSRRDDGDDDEGGSGNDSPESVSDAGEFYSDSEDCSEEDEENQVVPLSNSPPVDTTASSGGSEENVALSSSKRKRENAFESEDENRCCSSDSLDLSLLSPLKMRPSSSGRASPWTLYLTLLKPLSHWYNEHDQPVCRVCDVVIKSESFWPAHQASRKHHEAINKLKANAAALNRSSVAKYESAKELPKPIPEPSRDLIDKSEPSSSSCTQSSSLPPDFFDNHDKKRQKNERDSVQYRDANFHKKDSVSAKTQDSGSGTYRSSSAQCMRMRNPEVPASKDSRQVSGTAAGLEDKLLKGVLPTGFFDDKDADLRARGIKPVKPDAKDEYKEFEKLIQVDLQEIDDRLEEEEFVAAEVIEEDETVEQRAYLERVEMLRRKKLELRTSRAAVVVGKDTEVVHKKSRDEDSSSDEDVDVKVDWRAKHL
ncbi:hypothetical protein OROHE_008449 [Orobanche hederae]